MSRATRTGCPSTLRLVALAIAAPLLLAGCTSANSGSATAETSSASGTETKATHSAVALRDGWAKAGKGMTGVFGSIVNHGDTDLVLTSVESSSAGMIELHETDTSGSASTMHEVDGGFTIPAGGSFTLEPGGSHIMLMDMLDALLPGDEIPLTLTFDDGTTLAVTVLVKDFGGAQENYEGSDDHGSTDEHDAHDADDTGR